MLEYQYLMPKKSSKSRSLSSIFLNSLFSGLRTLSFLNCMFLRSLRLIALLLRILEVSRPFLWISWLLETERSLSFFSYVYFVYIESSEFTASSFGGRMIDELTLSSTCFGSDTFITTSGFCYTLTYAEWASGFEWGIIGGRIAGVVRLIFCFLFSFSTIFGAATNFETGFSSSWLPLSSHLFFLGDGLVTLALLALSLFSLELVLCIFSSLSTSCFFVLIN